VTDPIKVRFTIHIVQQDIDRSRRGRDTSYNNPICIAIKRQWELDYGVGVRFGAGYGNIYYEEEVHSFSFVEYKAQSAWFADWEQSKPVPPVDFVMQLDKVKTLPGSAKLPVKVRLL
jgi:hypothetical protein